MLVNTTNHVGFSHANGPLKPTGIGTFFTTQTQW